MSGDADLGGDVPELHATVERIAGIDALRGGRRILAASVDLQGRPIVACVPAVRASTPDQGASRSGLADHPYRVEIFRCGDGEWSLYAETETDLRAPHIQLLPDGALLMVATHSFRDPAGVAEPNAVVYLDGREAHRFVAGDGVQDVRVTPGGHIWISYLDAGTMGNFGERGWGRLSPEEWIDPVGASGLLEFDIDGTIQRAFAPPSGVHDIVDCYALNLDGEDPWLSYHPNFPIVRVGQPAQAWSTDLHGISALVIDEARVLAYVGYGRHPGSARFGTLADGALRSAAPLRLHFPDGTAVGGTRWARGFGADLHLLTHKGWHRLDLRRVS